MVIDTSALLAMFLAEPERPVFLDLILEAGIVLEARRGESAGREFDLFVVRTNLEIVPVDAEQIEIARSAWRSFGKGRHPAALNFGDCFAYALARASGEPILAKGQDFALTDIGLCTN